MIQVICFFYNSRFLFNLIDLLIIRAAINLSKEDLVVFRHFLEFFKAKNFFPTSASEFFDFTIEKRFEIADKSKSSYSQTEKVADKSKSSNSQTENVADKSKSSNSQTENVADKSKSSNSQPEIREIPETPEIQPGSPSSVTFDASKKLPDSSPLIIPTDSESEDEITPVAKKQKLNGQDPVIIPPNTRKNFSQCSIIKCNIQGK